MARVTARKLAMGFGGFFIAMFAFAWYFTRDLTSPWYGADLSRWVYASFLIASALLLAGVLTSVARRTASLDRRIAVLEGDAEAQPSSSRGPPGPTKDRVDRDIDDLLGKLADMGPGQGGTDLEVLEDVAPEGLGPLVTMEPEPISMEDSPQESLARARLQAARRSARAYAAGPALVTVVFMGISGAMLPGVDAFLQTYHQLNTILILGIGYNWAGLGAYVVASVLAMLRES